jgi:hypothetical protein
MPPRKATPKAKSVADLSFTEQRAEYVALLHWFTEECDKHVLANEKASDMRASSAARSHVRQSFPEQWARLVELEKAGQGRLL